MAMLNNQRVKLVYVIVWQHIQSIAAKSKFLSTPPQKNIETYRKVTSYYNGGTSRLYNSLSFWQPAPKNIVDLDHSCDHLQKDQTQGVS